MIEFTYAFRLILLYVITLVIHLIYIIRHLKCEDNKI